tara:strand:- start:5823 stop:8222 length:2400 start_codon:yes stop_codon:yes gene_type:complete
MAESIINRHFPSQVVSDIEKMSYDYGVKVAKAIQHEWFTKSHSDTNRHNYNVSKFHQLRLYARGEQSIQKYKDELSINGDLSYLNLDWTPVPIISKFVDIVVNGIAERLYDVKAYSQDPFGVVKRTEYMKNIQKDMEMKEFDDFVKNNFAINTKESKIDELPATEEELSLHMQLNYKQAIEIAEEQAINMLFRGNQYDLIKKRFYRDLVVCGIGVVKTSFNTSEGVTIDYVDPANLVYSYTESPYFEDIYYAGEVKSIPINELKKQFAYLDHEALEEITNSSSGTHANYYGTNSRNADSDNNKVDVLYFNYKTYMNEVYKIKRMGSGNDKAITKNDSLPDSDRYEKVQKSLECLYEGVYILGANKLIKWERASNMLRPKSDYTKVKMNYAIVAPRMYEGRIDSLVNRVTGFADMIQLTHLKIQQVMSRMTPDGVFLDVDGLAEVDLGNGTSYNPQEALNMFFQTGSIVGRSYNQEGDGNPGKIPIQEINNGAGAANKIQGLIQTYNYYLQMIRDVTGLNEASDGSTPAERSLVGVQKLAAANSNTATRHILQSGLFLTAEIAEQLSLRISDIIEYSPTKNAFIESIGAHNVATLKEMSELHLYDFGIFIELEPDEEEKQLLEQNIQTALSQQSIELEDAIDLRAIKNIKLANQLLKLRRRKKMQQDQQNQLEQTKAQGDAQAKASEAAAKADIKKQEAGVKSQIRLEEIKTQGKTQVLQAEASIKEKLMQLEFQYNMQLKQLEARTKTATQLLTENRKDDRTKMQATQQSAMIDQKENGKPSQNFESSSDSLGGFDLGI